MGLIALCGIVVRNAIILVDYTNEKIREGHSLQEAAMEAGERRLRPIFLTTMAAAAGVLPMILSKSSLWSPLASVLAIGLIWSMFITLLVVPVLFVIVKSRMSKPSPPHTVAATLILGLILLANPAFAETKRLTLPEAVDLALKGNSAVNIARFKVDEKAKAVDATTANFYPRLSNYSLYQGTSESQLVTLPVPGAGTIPVSSQNVSKGSSTLFLNGTVLGQPLTQLLKIHEAAVIARSDQKVAEADVKKAENAVIFAVHQLYYGLLVARRQKDAAEAGLSAAQESLREAENAVRARNLLEVSLTESRTAVLQNKQSLLAANIQIADLNAELNQLLGLPLATELELSDPSPSKGPVESRDYYLQAALCRNPEIESAKASVVKAQGGVRAAKDEYIPDVTLFAANTYQDGISFAKNNVGTFGLFMSWDIWDWGKRSAVIGERRAQLSQATENVRRLNDQVTVELDKAYRKLDNTKSMLDVAREALALQRERLRLVSDQIKTSTASYTKYNEAVAAFKKAEADELLARLTYELAIAELNRIAGTFER
jgi:outer membrane protein TolC